MRSPLCSFFFFSTSFRPKWYAADFHRAFVAQPGPGGMSDSGRPAMPTILLIRDFSGTQQIFIVIPVVRSRFS